MKGRNGQRTGREAAQAVFRQFASNLAGKISKGGSGEAKPARPPLGPRDGKA